ncbi:BTB/POZ domain-containing protein [Nymphaea thermarum]|nr:BTB/POZ domain-containing protein [Nymphaea thermarum]
MASEKPPSKGQAWFCTTGLPSDVIIEVEEMAFHLHKFPLMSRSGKLHRMITEQEISTHREGEEEEEQEEEEEECYLLNLPGFPGGSEAFEIAAKFCYGVKVELTPLNVGPLRCAAEYLEMTEEHGDGNLIARTEAFLNQSVLRSLKDAVKTLSSCERLLPTAEDLGIVERCIDAIAMNAGADQLASGDLASPNGSILWNGIDTGLRHRDQVRPDWWYDELAVLGLPFYKRVVSTMEARDLNPESIEGSLVCYAKKFIPGLSRRNRVSSSHSTSVAPEDEQRELLETVVSHMPVRKSSNPTTTARLLFGLLRTANILSASDSCRTTLERKIAAQLDQATLDDLLLPSYSYLIETLYDIDCVERILEYFLEGCGGADAEEGEEDEEARRYGNSPGMNPVMVVGKLMDGYLAEIASDGNLKPEKFYNLAVALPDHARVYDDGLYRAIDVYLKAHPWISDEEREKICSLIDCQKLTLEACTHAAQNERLPLRVVVQVLFFEQLQLRNAIAGSIVAPDASLPDSGHPVRLQDHIGFLGQSPAAQPWQTTVRNNQVLRFDMDSMRARVHELERECSTMRRAIRKFDKAKKGGGVGGGSSGGGGGGGDAEDGGNGGWSSFTKKFGCKFKTQVCDSHERTWVEAKKGSHHHQHNRNSSLT